MNEQEIAGNGAEFNSVEKQTEFTGPAESEVTKAGLEYVEALETNINSEEAAEILAYIERVEVAESGVVDQIEEALGGREELDLLRDGFWLNLSKVLNTTMGLEEREKIFAAEGVAIPITIQTAKDGNLDVWPCRAGGDIFSSLLARDVAYQLTSSGAISREAEKDLISLLVCSDRLDYGSLNGTIARADRTKILLPKILTLGDSLGNSEFRAMIQKEVEARGKEIRCLTNIHRAHVVSKWPLDHLPAGFDPTTHIAEEESLVRNNSNEKVRSSADKIIESGKQAAEVSLGNDGDNQFGHDLPHLSGVRSGHSHCGFRPWKPVEGMVRIPEPEKN